MIEYTVIVKGTCLSEAHCYLMDVCKNEFKYEYMVFIKGESFDNEMYDNQNKSYIFKVCCGMYDIKTIAKLKDMQVFKNL